MTNNSQNVNVPEKTDTGQRTHSELDLYSRAIDDGGVFPGTNLGLGYYNDAEYFQLAEQYKFGMFADAAFSGPLAERAVKEAKHGLAREGWVWYDSDKDRRRRKPGWEDLDKEDRAEQDRRRYLEERGEELWEELPERERQQALVEHAGMLRDWEPPQHELLKMRHESSRSRDARLLDNLFGRIKEVKGNAGERAKKKLEQLSGGGIR